MEKKNTIKKIKKKNPKTEKYFTKAEIRIFNEWYDRTHKTVRRI